MCWISKELSSVILPSCTLESKKQTHKRGNSQESENGNNVGHKNQRVINVCVNLTDYID